ncbi:MAG TPA: hypothetical protein VHD87_03860 [Acidimicrobiales bacterium]|nr:hypothetical protein [Acidimicrobiales bacterium]
MLLARLADTRNIELMPPSSMCDVDVVALGLKLHPDLIHVMYRPTHPPAGDRPASSAPTVPTPTRIPPRST